MSAWGSALSILDWLKDKLPIQNRMERIKNEIDKLEIEKRKLLSQKCNVELQRRLVWVDTRLGYLYGLCKNKATD